MFNTALKSFARKPLPSLASKSLPTATFATRVLPFEEHKIMLTGCQGQLGIPLAKALCKEVGPENVIATDLTP